MRTFKGIGKGKCLICNSSDEGEVILAGIDGTRDDNLEEAIPVHVKCLDFFRVNKECRVIYLRY